MCSLVSNSNITAMGRTLMAGARHFQSKGGRPRQEDQDLRISDKYISYLFGAVLGSEKLLVATMSRDMVSKP